MNAIASPAASIVFACGDCAGEILRAGGKYAKGLHELPAGRECQVHPSGRPPMVATNAITPKRGWARRQASAEAPPLEVAASPLPVTMGPLTEIATRICVAWAAADRTALDDGTVQHAVLLAEKILRETDGA